MSALVDDYLIKSDHFEVFLAALMSLLFIKFQWNGLFRAKGGCDTPVYEIQGGI